MLAGAGPARRDAYRWLCGKVQVNYHTLADFRGMQGAALDELLTTTVANLLESGGVTLKRVAQDGVRVRAAAGAASFRRKARLESFLDEARVQIASLKAQLDTDPGQASRAQAAGRGPRALQSYEPNVEST